MAFPFVSISVSGAKMRIHRGLEQLRDKLREEGSDLEAATARAKKNPVRTRARAISVSTGEVKNQFRTG